MRLSVVGIFDVFHQVGFLRIVVIGEGAGTYDDISTDVIVEVENNTGETREEKSEVPVQVDFKKLMIQLTE